MHNGSFTYGVGKSTSDDRPGVLAVPFSGATSPKLLVVSNFDESPEPAEDLVGSQPPYKVVQ